MGQSAKKVRGSLGPGGIVHRRLRGISFAFLSARHQAKLSEADARIIAIMFDGTIGILCVASIRRTAPVNEQPKRMSSPFHQIADALAAADALVVTAGAGMGVDSGLPDFRGKE